MALNYTHRPIFPAHTAEDNLVSPMRIVNGYLVEGVPERNGDGFARPRCASREIEERFDYARDRARADRCGSPEGVPKDIIDLLPSDPFGMDITTTVTAITGWLEDLEVDYGVFGRSYMGGAYNEEYDLFADLNLIWNNAMRFQSFPSNAQMDENSKMDTDQNLQDEKRNLGDALAQCLSGSACNEGDIAGSNNASTSADALRVGEKTEGLTSCSVENEGYPHEALCYAFRFLGLKDLLCVGMVCRDLYKKVCNDNLLWRSVHIDQPLNERISDDILLQLTSRAEGNLECLSLAECPRITDDGVRRVLETNPRLTKLCVPGCTRLSIAGIITILKAFNSNKDTVGIKHLRIGGLYGMTHEHYDEIMFLLGTNSSVQHHSHKPRFYHRGNIYLSCDDDRAIDVETCPRCEKLRLVYDCPADACQTKDQNAPGCRACTLCIARCVQCGRCINDHEYEETFCLELLCSDCFKQLPRFQGNSSQSIGPT